MKARALLSILLVAFLCASQAAVAGLAYSGSYRAPDGGLWPPLSHYQPVRDYLLYVPGSYTRSGSPYPLVVMLHGCRQSAESFAAGTGMNALAEQEDFLVLYPNQHANPIQCWNWFDGATQDGAGEAAIITGMVREIMHQYRVDAARIYVAGLSAGGGMTSVLVSCYPGVFAAAAIHSGVAYKAAYFANAELALRRVDASMPADIAGRRAYECAKGARLSMPVIVFHGAEDKRVVPGHAAQVIRQFAQTNDYADDGKDNDSVSAASAARRNVYPKGRRPYTVYSYGKGDRVLLQLFMIRGMGHAWSGGTPVLEGDHYYDPAGPDASQEIWTFFKRHRRAPQR
ncbi:MAG TPA: PHB depolymerase family esterase [Noviherbaspirillum sp.]|uniref:extracellular catalytic domain type 1 short-chain-length polyhydroxyalkanoate depolymerase n=1 Tax=Noviherbaspirillum sp. TaxID=1926288 RepID=UPI002D6164C0|nr:PHB depolymerase family esterase [Noviherbaspirillum sp.]HYD96625.1 PHB depolymerase family esterase [Noviherbaspirillum sp.]